MKQKHLPKEPNQRAQLIKRLQIKLSKADVENKPQQKNNQFAKVQQINQNNLIKKQQKDQQLSQNQKQVLKLRLKLIADCAELSVERISHLQQIFKHYCTHIFKIGKHMTFQRLQYEKVHLTLDRLCVFLKDFGLTCAKIDGIQQQIVDKKQIVRNFKRLSKNCRDLGFQQFIACLQKLAVVYYDQKQIYQQKCHKFKQDRQVRIAQYKKKMKEKKKQQQARKKSLVNSGQKNVNQNIQSNNEQNNHQQKQQQQKNEQNDDLIEKMLEDQKIQNPNDQVKKAIGLQVQNQFQNENQTIKKNRKNQKKIGEQQFLLTVQQKVQFFYQLIGVDNAHDFRKKMSELGLPLFKQYQPHAKPPTKRSSSTKNTTQLLNVVIQNDDRQDQKRLIQLRQKLSIKRQRDKHLHSPLLSKQQYQQRKKKREEKQSQIMKQLNISKVSGDTTTVKEKEKKKIELGDKQLSLDMLNHLSFEDLKNKFDPKKYVHSDQSDQIYLNQYGSQIQQAASGRNKKNNVVKSFIRENTGIILQRKRTSSNIVEDFKKRAYQIQVKQFKKQAQLSKFVDQMKKRQKQKKKVI